MIKRQFSFLTSISKCSKAINDIIESGAVITKSFKSTTDRYDRDTKMYFILQFKNQESLDLFHRFGNETSPLDYSVLGDK
jgi:hypothetical protein